MKDRIKPSVRYIFVIGAKSIGQYGGYETFIDKLTELHQNNPHLQYCVLTKANGEGHMEEQNLSNIIPVDKCTFFFRNARIVKVRVPQIGHAQSLYYDIRAWRYCLGFAKENRIENPVFYVLGCRRSLFFRQTAKKAHELGGTVCMNPDGHEWKRAKWPAPIRRYMKSAERFMVKYADCVICDSAHIEKYIQDTYSAFKPQTEYIAYGAETRRSSLADDDPSFVQWLEENGLRAHEYYMSCGRLVPENSYETMIREFMASHSTKNFAIISTDNDRFLKELKRKLAFESDPRIRFVGTVYDRELLMKIRENAFANIHGHAVGGTNPSLLEGLGSTDVNLVIDVDFNREVAGDAALYWEPVEGSLAGLINKTDAMTSGKRSEFGCRAKERIRSAYSWEQIADRYEQLWERSGEQNPLAGE